MNTFVSSAPAQTTSSATIGRTLFRWFKRGLFGLLLLLMALAASGAAYQAAATAWDRRSLPLSGELVDVGTHQLHLVCTGPTDSGNPTVILEAGLGATASAWAWIQPEIAKTARVCAYDRAGMGWSEGSSEPRDAQHIAEELHTLLHNAGIAGPYTLVGWSYGGLYMRTYAGSYPAEVAGLVLLDSSFPDQCTSTPAGEAQCNSPKRVYQIAPVLARVGIARLFALLQPASGLPEPQSSELIASYSATKDWDTQSAEYLASSATNAQARIAIMPEGIPLLVLTATDHGTPPDLEQLWQGWQSEMATLSTNSVHRVVAGASHTSLVFDAKDAAVSAQAILQVVAAARSGKPLASK